MEEKTDNKQSVMLQSGVLTESLMVASQMIVGSGEGSDVRVKVKDKGWGQEWAGMVAGNC